VTEPDPVADRLALTELVARLNRWLDDPSTGDARSFCTADVEIVAPRTRGRGATDVERRLRGDGGSNSDSDERSQRLATDVVVDLDGDRAEVGANLLDCSFRPGRPLHRMAGLRYGFSAVRTPQGWRFARVTVALQWSHHPERP